jgi:hypothetical protein
MKPLFLMNKMIEKEDLRIVFYGTPSFAVPTLEKLIEEKGFYGAVESICDVINEEYALPCDYLTCRGLQECLSDILFLVELREEQANDKD